MNKPLVYVIVNTLFILAGLVALAHQEGRNLFYWFAFLLNTNLLIFCALSVYPQQDESKPKRVSAFINIILLILIQISFFFVFLTFNFKLFSPILLLLFFAIITLRDEQ